MTVHPTTLIRSDQTFESVGRSIEQAAFGKVQPAWWLAVAASVGLIGLLVVSVGWLFVEGVGVWGNNIPVTWALDIVGYDWWIGVATGSLVLSVLPLLLDRSWRGAIARVSETVAVLAAVAAGIYPIIHLGRPWFFYWNLPYPNTMVLWPQFRSPLYWDAIDILGFLVVSLSVWYLGLLPDLAGLRDRAVDRLHGDDREGSGGRFARRIAQFYGVAALGWRSSAPHWHRRGQALRIIGLLGIVVVVSLQTGAAVMFAGAPEPGWHDTLEPVEFVVVALFSGVAASTLVVVVVRAAFSLGGVITEAHLDRLGRLLLGIGLLDAYCVATEMFATGTSGNSYAVASMAQRLHGPHAWAFWTMVLAGLLPVQLLWLKGARQSPPLLLLIALAVCVGTWADHFMVIVVTLQHDFLPSSDQAYSIGLWAVATFLGSCGLFLFLLLLAMRLLPVLAAAPVRALTHPGAESTRTPVSSDRIDLPKDAPLWGVAAEYDEADQMIRAASSLRQHRLGRIDLYSPVPLPEAAALLSLSGPGIRPLAVAGAVLGGAAMMAMCLLATGYDYVFLIGGRPRFSWQAFVVPTVSFAALSGTVVGIAAMLFGNRMPRLNHPAFNIPGIGGATRDRYFLVVEAREEFDPGAVEAAIAALPDRPLVVHRVRR